MPATCLDWQKLILGLTAVLNRLILTKTSFNDCSRLLIFLLFSRSLLLFWLLDDLIGKTEEVNWDFAVLASSSCILSLFGL